MTHSLEDWHELQDQSGHDQSPPGSQDSPPSSQHAHPRTPPRVRINSTAAEIPQIGGYARLQEVESQDAESQPAQAVVDSSVAEAEGLLRAHQHHEISTHEKTRNEMPEEDNGYEVTRGTQGGIFYQLLQAYKTSIPATSDETLTGGTAAVGTSTTSKPGSSGNVTPRRKWYEQGKSDASQETLATLVGVATQLANPGSKDDVRYRPGHKRTQSGSRILSRVLKAKEDQNTKIKYHVADILKRQQYIIKMCRALMLFGAPTHRLEEYLATSAKALDINSQFLYIPGCMIISFDDSLTHTAEVKIVRTAQGVSLGKLIDTHDIYKEVLHDIIGLDEAISRLDDVINAKERHPTWLNVLMYGLASTAVSGFFKARWIDMPIIFILGTLLGFLQLVVSPLSNTYSTVFEVSSTILLTFLSRMFGSINGGSLFCFSALTQSSIAMILPGWLVLSSSLELQSRAIVPGSIRLVFAVIYSLFLGYGITVGTALYGAIDINATEETVCRDPLSPYWNFLFVPLYVFFTTFTVQAKYKQMPVMIVIALAGYIVNFYASKKFSASAPIAYTFGALAIGVLANLYSRLRHGVAAAVLLPAVYVQVPGSLASSGAIANALTTASSLIKGAANVTVDAQINQLNVISFNVAASMIQIAIGITVGLFMSALVVYPMGKRRSGLWTL